MTFEVSTVRSEDNTDIAYRKYGQGPAIILIHGGAGGAQSFSKLAEILAPEFTVYVPDRRGRGRSGAFSADHSLATESADLKALLEQSGARSVFGLSAGAVIALYAATQSSNIEKLALYEPPLFVNGVRPDRWVDRYDRELDRGDLAAALITVLKGTADSDDPLRYLPRIVLHPLFRLILRKEKKQPDRIPFRELIPTLRYDARLVREAEPMLDRFSSIRCETLLLGGSRSARDLQLGLIALADKLPNARRVVLQKTGHTAAFDEGKPGCVAEHLREFFTL